MLLRHVHKFLLIMRITIVILIATMLQVSAAGFAQNVTFHSGKATLKQLFKEIKKQTGYNVLYNSDELNNTHFIVADYKDTPLSEVLSKSLSGQNLTYTIDKKTIVIRQEIRVNAVPVVLINVHGKVEDENGKGLAGVTVKLKDGSKATVTDADGYYVLTQIDEKAILLITYVGYSPKELKVKTDMGTIRMTVASSKLDEVVVTVNNGYERLPKERSAGSFSVITKETLEKRSNFSVKDYLDGQLPGLLSSSQQFVVRGKSTLNADASPLIVLDGFIVNYGLDAISPNDIESITLLKDASAASIWGVRAANGVIVIQSKRNSALSKPLEISFNTSVSVTQKQDLSKLPLANSASFLEYEKYKADNKLVYTGAAPFRTALSQGLDAYINHPADAAAIVAGLKGNNVLDEFSDLFMQRAVRQQYNFSIAGKGPKSYSRASFTYDDVQSGFKNTGNTRFLADVYQKTDLTSKLTVELGLNLLMTTAKADGMSLTDLNSIAPYQKILDNNGNYIPQPMSIYQADKDAWVKKGYLNWDYNLKQEADNKNSVYTNQYVTAMAGINYKILKGFSFNSAYKFESNRGDNAVVYNDQTYYNRSTINYATYANTAGVLTYGIPKGAIISNSNAKGQTHIFRNQLTYNGNVINSDHQVTAIAGMEIQQVGSSSNNNTNYGFDTQTLAFSPTAYNTSYTTIQGYTSTLQQQNSVGLVKNRYISYYANAGYTYLDKYSINGSARQDQTNLFGASSKYRNVWLWSTGVAWQAHKESFLMDGPFSSLIVRASIGVNGNVDRSTSPFLIANIASADRDTGLPFAYVTSPENPALRWEKTTVSNIGVDFATLKGRLNGSVEYYNKKSTDLLGNSTVNDTYGFSSAYINYASMNNKGVDVHLTALLLKGDFNLATTINYSYNKNTVTNVQFPQSTAGSFIIGAPQKGLPLNYLYSYKWAGLSATGAPQIYDASGKIVPYTTEMTDPKGLVYQGSTTPAHYGGVFTTVGYKDLSLTAGFVYNAGYKFRVPVISYAQIYNTTATGALSSDWDKRWKNPGDENRTTIPAMPSSSLSLTNYDAYSTYASVNVQNAANIRFQELILNYKLPAGLFKTSRSVINVGLQARNLAVYTFNKGHLDPNYLSYNGSPNLRPAPEFTLMFKANF
ncbi:MAG: SusC/RagA family TonB-linked outer membrane protein [Mucilaginibacter sp.]|nr:SusC/RagA family TonB-linked outer membrane protein [Mucilaginibacter sp.]